jgi:hypothetical protein
MASTRSKNTIGNYSLEKNAYSNQENYTIFENGFSGRAYETYFAGNGLLHGRISATELSTNACDIETMLRGIGSTNLEITNTPIVPQIRNIESLNVITKLPVYIPSKLVIEPNQRPQFR